MTNKLQRKPFIVQSFPRRAVRKSDEKEGVDKKTDYITLKNMVSNFKTIF